MALSRRIRRQRIRLPLNAAKKPSNRVTAPSGDQSASAREERQRLAIRMKIRTALIGVPR
jgi:hypothetical protein